MAAYRRLSTCSLAALRLTSDYIHSASSIGKAPYIVDHYIVMYR